MYINGANKSNPKLLVYRRPHFRIPERHLFVLQLRPLLQNWKQLCRCLLPIHQNIARSLLWLMLRRYQCYFAIHNF